MEDLGGGITEGCHLRRGTHYIEKKFLQRDLGESKIKYTNFKIPPRVSLVPRKEIGRIIDPTPHGT